MSDILGVESSYQDVLRHYGVKGMRWGVRKDSSGSSSGSSKSESVKKAAAKTASAAKKTAVAAGKSAGLAGKAASKTVGVAKSYAARRADKKKLKTEAEEVRLYYATQEKRLGISKALKRKSTDPNIPLSEDAIKTAMAQQKLKKGGIATLSNNDLALLINRMNLEQRAGGLIADAATGRNSVHDFVVGMLAKEGKAQASRVVNLVAANKINQMLEQRGIPVEKKKGEKDKVKVKMS